ncbi:MAG: hypothetical protein Kow002_00740 [Anaerolineales bacterium]
MKSCFPLLIMILLTSCAQVPAVTDTSTLDADLPTPIKQNINTADITPNSYDLGGRILVYTPETVYLANSDGTFPVSIHTIHAPLSMMSLSPDGTNLAYFIGNYLYVKNIATGNINTLNQETMGSIGGQLKYSPDGKKIALACSTLSEPTASICLIDESGNIEYLVREENIEHKIKPDYFIELLDWSRDGSKLVFLYYTPSEKGQKQDFSIYCYDMFSKTTQLILSGQNQNLIFQMRGASISPDNKTLLINGIGENSLFQIFALNMETGNLFQIQLTLNASLTNPVWSNDNCCFYVHAEQNDHDQYTVIANLKGSIIETLSFPGYVIQWVE